MFEAIYSSGTALYGLQQQHEIIAENLAHTNSVGFRRNISTFEHFVQDPDRLQDLKYGHGVELTQSEFDFTQGQMNRTGRPLDVALNGDGFLVLEGPNGNVVTRNGVLFRSPEGNLINTEGFPVLGQDGPINIPQNITEGQILIGETGEVYANGNSVGSLLIQDIPDKSKMTRAGEFSFEYGDQEPVAGTARVIQFSRESANTSAVTELVSLISASRHYEAASRSIQTISEALRKSTNS